MNDYIKTLFVGLGVGLIVAVILAVIGIWLESEYIFALMVGVGIVGTTIRYYLPKNSFGGALIGVIVCSATYFIYQLIMALFDYYYEEGESYFWIMLGVSVIFGAWAGYNREDND